MTVSSLYSKGHYVIVKIMKKKIQIKKCPQSFF